MRGSQSLSGALVGGMALAVGLTGVAAAAYQTAVHRPAMRAAVATPLSRGTPVLTLSALPDRVAYGDTVEVSGVLRGGDGLGLAGRTVDAVAASLGAPPEGARTVGTGVTDALGGVSVPVRLVAGSSIRLRYSGAPDAGSVYSVAAPVRVAARVTVRAATWLARGQWATTLRGAVAPGGPGDRVRLDRAGAHGHWHAVAVGALRRDGGYAFTVRHARAGTYTYRVVRPAAAAVGGGTATYALRLRAPRAPALPPPPAAHTGGPGELLVTGDSLAYYLGQQLAAARGARPTTVESRPSSGLARPDYFDWTARAREQVAGRPGAVVVFVGANDCQPVRSQATGAWAPVGSAAWVTEYRRRAGSLMAVYRHGIGDVGGVDRTGGAAGVTRPVDRPVYWVGLPIARKADIAACYRGLNAATAAAARDVGGVTWIESWSLYAVDGRYDDHVGGVLARQDDGIHLTFDGTRFLTRKVLGVLRP